MNSQCLSIRAAFIPGTLGRAEAGTATILDTKATSGALGSVLQEEAAFWHASNSCKGHCCCSGQQGIASTHRPSCITRHGLVMHSW